MDYGDVLPIKGFVSEALNFTSLFPAKGGGDRGTEGIINIINVLSGTLTERALVKI